LCTACVAVTQSGNEQGVKQGKLSWFVKNGMKHKLMDIDLMCDMWEAWTFRVNFMYKDFQDKVDLVCIIFKPPTLASALIQLKEARYLVLIAGSPSILAK
jgi:hypothetical protein